MIENRCLLEWRPELGIYQCRMCGRIDYAYSDDAWNAECPGREVYTRDYRGWHVWESEVGADIYTPRGRIAYIKAPLDETDGMIDTLIATAPVCGNVEPHNFHHVQWMDEHFKQHKEWCFGRCTCSTIPHHGPGHHK